MFSFWPAVLILAGLLLYPVATMIWVMSVRRLERKLSRPLDEHERTGQKNRAWILATFLCLLFSFLFNISMVSSGIGNG